MENLQRVKNYSFIRNTILYLILTFFINSMSLDNITIFEEIRFFFPRRPIFLFIAIIYTLGYSYYICDSFYNYYNMHKLLIIRLGKKGYKNFIIKKTVIFFLYIIFLEIIINIIMYSSIFSISIIITLLYASIISITRYICNCDKGEVLIIAIMLFIARIVLNIMIY